MDFFFLSIFFSSTNIINLGAEVCAHLGFCKKKIHADRRAYVHLFVSLQFTSIRTLYIVKQIPSIEVYTQFIHLYRYMYMFFLFVLLFFFGFFFRVGFFSCHIICALTRLTNKFCDKPSYPK